MTVGDILGAWKEQNKLATRLVDANQKALLWKRVAILLSIVNVILLGVIIL